MDPGGPPSAHSAGSYRHGHSGQASLASEPGSNGSSIEVLPQAARAGDGGSPGTSRSGSANSQGSGRDRRDSGGSGVSGGSGKGTGTGEGKKASQSSHFEERKPGRAESAKNGRRGRGRGGGEGVSVAQLTGAASGVDTAMNVKLRVELNPRLHTPAPSAHDLVAAAKEAVDDRERQRPRGHTEEEAFQAKHKVNSALSYVVAANAMRNRMLAEISVHAAWDTTNTRMLIRCLDLVPQSCYALLTADADGSSSASSGMAPILSYEKLMPHSKMLICSPFVEAGLP